MERTQLHAFVRRLPPSVLTLKASQQGRHVSVTCRRIESGFDHNEGLISARVRGVSAAIIDSKVQTDDQACCAELDGVRKSPVGGFKRSARARQCGRPHRRER